MSEPVNFEAIAIVGMAGRFPKARNVAALWQNLRQGVECISHFTEEELEEAGIDFPKGNPNYVKARGLLEEPEMFDAAFFGVNPKEAEIIDPQQRVFLECAWEALEDAGYDPGREERSVGVFAGMSMNTYLPANLSTHPELMELVGGYQMMLANDKDFLPTRVSYKLNLKGPSLSIQTACSTSLVAVCVACQHLLNFQCDLALAGGVSIIFPQKKGHLYQEGSIVSPDGHCRAFDAKAQGTVAGEGAGIVALKRLSEARAEGDHIYAVIKGFALNNDGSAKVGFTAPSVEGQAEVIALAQAVAGVEPESLQYVVTHGTGTPLGDPIEVAGLTKAFRAGTAAKNFCALGSIKTNIGHLDAAAGVAGLINAALALEHKEIPPSLHYESPNPKIDFANSPFFVNARLRLWERGATPRRAGVSSFGIGGTNAHVVLEEAPEPAALAKSRPIQVLALSARTNAALEKATDNLLEHLRQNPEVNLADVAYTLQTGRRAFPHRRALVCENTLEAIQVLQKREPSRVFTREHKEPDTAPVVFMFPGQGSQHPNMGREIYESEALFREQIDKCAEILRPHLGLDLREALYPAPEKMDFAREQLGQTWLTQPAIFATSYALARLWMSWGVQPESMIGHSVGEYVAACLAGVFSLPDALGLVAARGRMVQQQPPGGMLAVRLPESGVKELLSQDISLAAVNSPNLSVLSGPREALHLLQQQLRAKGVASNYLDTSHAFHSAMMDPAVGPLTDLVRTTSLKGPRIPYVSTVSATWATAAQTTDPAYWGRHMRETVRFAPALEELLKNPGRVLLEAGPGQVLSNLAKQHPARRSGQTVVASLRHAQSEQKDTAVLMTALGQLWLAGVPIQWNKFYAKERRQRVSLPAYPFERKKFWVEPIRPVRQTLVTTASLGVPALRIEKELAADIVQTVPDPVPAEKDLIFSMLQTLFGMLSGLETGQIQGGSTYLEMGFDSLFLTQASQAIENIFGAHIPFGQLLDEFSTLDLLSAHLASLVPATPEAVRMLKDKMSALAGTWPNTRTPKESAAASNAESVPLLVPLTDGQTEIWFASQVSAEDSCVFNLNIAVQLKGPLNVPALRQALQTLVERHQALRTTFPPDGLAQKILPSLTLEIPLIDRSEISGPGVAQALQAISEQEQQIPFDLVNGPLLRGQIVRFGPEHHALILTAHHLACDGGSLSTLQKELSELYSAAVEKRQPNLRPAPLYSEYALARARTRESPKWLEDESFWLAQFAKPAPPLEWPLDHPRTSDQTAFSGGLTRTRLEPSLYRDLKRLGASQHCTLFTALLAGYVLLLYRLTGREDLVIGIPAAQRANEDHERLVGSCVNFLPLRVRVNPNATFAEHLWQVRKIFSDSFEHRMYSLGSLVRKLHLPRDLTRMPLVSATFNLQRRPNEWRLSGLQAEECSTPRGFTHFELTLNLCESEGELLVDCAYRRDLFKGESIDRWLSRLKDLLALMCARPESKLRGVPMMAEGESSQANKELPSPNALIALHPQDQSLAQLFDAPTLRSPDAAALSAPPRTANGAPDRQHLPWPPPKTDISVSAATLTATQAQLLQIWKEVIGVKELGLDDNFFDLGGHSVLVIQMLTRIRAAFGANLTLRTFFDAPTVGKLALEVDRCTVRKSALPVQAKDQATPLAAKE